MEHIRVADVVVTHAGVGSILTCLRLGRTPLVVPRQSRFGEHVDDHQVELTRALADDGKVIPVWDVADLPALVESAPAPAAVSMGTRTTDSSVRSGKPCSRSGGASSAGRRPAVPLAS